jgi:hypothetical protein
MAGCAQAAIRKMAIKIFFTAASVAGMKVAVECRLPWKPLLIRGEAWGKRGHPLFPGYLLGVVCKGPKTPFQSVVFPCGDTQSLQKRLQSAGKGTSGIRGGRLSFVEPDDQKVRFCGNQQV